MQDSQKFLLLEAKDVDKLLREKTTTERLQPLQTRELHKLDRSMLEVLNDSSLSEHDKVKKYNSILTEFQSVIDYKPRSAVLNNQPRKEDKKQYNSTLGIPIQFKKRAQSLLSYLTDRGDLTLSDNGEVYIKGSYKRGSNITDILNKAVNPKSKLTNPIGWEDFTKLLQENNVPQSLLAAKVQKEETSYPTAQSPQKAEKKRSSRIPRPNNELQNWITHDSPNASKKKRAQL